MDFNLNFKVLERSEISEKTMHEMLDVFIQENEDLNEIYKIQIEEILGSLRRKLNLTGEEANGTP